MPAFCKLVKNLYLALNSNKNKDLESLVSLLSRTLTERTRLTGTRAKQFHLNPKVFLSSAWGQPQIPILRALLRATLKRDCPLRIRVL